MPLPFLNRQQFLPVLRYGNFAGPGYAGGIAGEDRVDPNDPASPTWAEYTRTPTGLAAFMQRAELVKPVDYFDSVTRIHDIDYTVVEFSNGRTTVFVTNVLDLGAGNDARWARAA